MELTITVPLPWKPGVERQIRRLLGDVQGVIEVGQTDTHSRYMALCDANGKTGTAIREAGQFEITLHDGRKATINEGE